MMRIRLARTGTAPVLRLVYRSSPANIPPKMPIAIVLISTNMIIAGIEAIDHLIIKTTIDQNGILISVTITSFLFVAVD